METVGHNYRLTQISQVQRSLEEERNKRRDLSKKYSRGVKIVNNADTLLTAASMGLGAAGVGLLATVVLAPVVLAMEGVAISAGFLSIIGKYATKKMSIKAKKHERIKILAEAKLNTISDLISKALSDGKISEEEFSSIMSELTKFREMKETVKSKSKEASDEVRETFTQYLKKPKK